MPPASPPSPDEFRRALRPLIGQVSVLTLVNEPAAGETAANETAMGITLTSANALSTQPPMLIACINRSAAVHPHLRAGAVIGWQALGHTHQDVAQRFAGQGDIARELRFDGADWVIETHLGQKVRLLSGAPMACAAVIEVLCDHATHAVMIARVLSLHIATGAGTLAYSGGAYLPLP